MELAFLSHQLFPTKVKALKADDTSVVMRYRTVLILRRNRLGGMVSIQAIQVRIPVTDAETDAEGGTSVMT